MNGFSLFFHSLSTVFTIFQHYTVALRLQMPVPSNLDHFPNSMHGMLDLLLPTCPKFVRPSGAQLLQRCFFVREKAWKKHCALRQHQLPRLRSSSRVPLVLTIKRKIKRLCFPQPSMNWPLNAKLDVCFGNEESAYNVVLLQELASGTSPNQCKTCCNFQPRVEGCILTLL